MLFDLDRVSNVTPKDNMCIIENYQEKQNFMNYFKITYLNQLKPLFSGKFYLFILLILKKYEIGVRLSQSLICRDLFL